MNKIIRIPIIFVISFILNFIWENLHFPLYSGNTIGIDNYWLLMLYASLIDAFYISIIFILIALINKNINWKINKKNLFLFSFSLIVIAIIIETRALLTGRWLYSAKMPAIFGIGLSPLVQLAITGIISLLVAKKLAK